MDWIKIKNEYINGNISYRKLAEKYNVSYRQIASVSKAENWVGLRKEQRIKTSTKLQQKTAEKIVEQEANRLLRISKAADRLLDKIEEATEQLDQFIVTSKIKQKEVVYVDDKAGFGKPKKELISEVEDKQIVKADHLDRLGLKQLASALKDIKDIQATSDTDNQNGSLERLIKGLKADE